MCHTKVAHFKLGFRRDKSPDSSSAGRRFESCCAHHSRTNLGTPPPLAAEARMPSAKAASSLIAPRRHEVQEQAGQLRVRQTGIARTHSKPPAKLSITHNFGADPCSQFDVCKT